MFIQEGISHTQPFDQAASQGGSTTGVEAAASPPVITTEPNELIFGVVIDGAVSTGLGYTLRGNDFGDVTEDRIATTPGSYVVTASTNGGWLATIAAFRPQ